MEPIEVTSYVLHALFAGLWTGAVIFVTLGVLPVARDGDMNAAPLRTIAQSLVRLSRLSAVILFITGSHMAAAVHTGDSLTGTTGGHLVLVMLALWAVLIGMVEVGTGKLRSGTTRDKVREPAREAWRFYFIASLTAVSLLVVSGLLSARSSGFL